MSLRSLSWVAVLLLIAPSTWAQSTSQVVTAANDTALVSVLTDAEPCRDTTAVDRAWRHAWSQLVGTASARTAGGRDVARLEYERAPVSLALLSGQDTPAGQEAQRKRPKAIEYSEGYATRAKIHRYASIATLPLFVAQYAVGQSLYNNSGSGEGGGNKGAHDALTVGIAGLFAANSVTGVWNLKEAWKDPNGRTRRTVHGILMLVADAGFVATGALAPGENEGGEHGGTFQAPTSSNSRSTHRAVAITSMGIATVSYLMMLLWRP